MNKTTTVLFLLLTALTGTASAADHTHTLTSGYANQRINGGLTGNTPGGNIKYHWDAVNRGVGIPGSATYTTANMTGPANKTVGDVYQYSILAGPSCRVNDYVSVYARQPRKVKRQPFCLWFWGSGSFCQKPGGRYSLSTQPIFG